MKFRDYFQDKWIGFVMCLVYIICPTAAFYIGKQYEMAFWTFIVAIVCSIGVIALGYYSCKDYMKRFYEYKQYEKDKYKDMNLEKLVDMIYNGEDIDPCEVYLQPTDKLNEDRDWHEEFWCDRGKCCDNENCSEEQQKECLQAYIKSIIE